jgi:hypothetical protein
MLSILERLRREWHMIKAAPFSFAIVCVVAITAFYGAFRWYYADKIKDANTRADQWKGDVDYWKDQAGRKPECPPTPHADPKTSTPKPLLPAKPSRRPEIGKANVVPSTTPSVKLDCEGGNCAVSNGQQGGITAGQINIGDVAKRLSPENIGKIAAFLQSAQVKSSISISAAQNTSGFADDLYEAFHEGGWALRESEVNLLISPVTPDDRRFGKVELCTKGQPVKEGEQVSFSPGEPMWYVGKVMAALRLPTTIIRSEDHDDTIELRIVSLPN